MIYQKNKTEETVTSILKFSNAVIILFVVFKITNIDNEKTVPLMLASLYIVIFIADMVIYGNKKYFSYLSITTVIDVFFFVFKCYK